MAFGPGKYDSLATYVREQTKAACVVLTVIGGDKGSGFSVQMVEGAIDPSAVAKVMRDVAASFEREGQS